MQEPTLDDLVELVETRYRNGSELERLAGAVAISEELAGLADELVGRFVEEARKAGCSWAQVGTQLGVTKQAAQQRFVPMGWGRGWRPPRRWSRGGTAVQAAAQAGAGPFERFTDRARKAVVAAHEEAQRLNHNYVGTEHLLLGVLVDETSVGSRAAVALGLSLDGARAKVTEIIGHGPVKPTTPAPFTPRAKKAFELALRAAHELHHNYIGTEHLLIGLARIEKGVAADILHSVGADDVDVRAKVIELLRDAR